MEGIAPLGTLDPQHAIAQLAKALADPARAFAFVRHRNGSSASWFSVLDAQAPRWHIFGVQGGPIWRQQLHQSFSIRRRRTLGFRPSTVRFTYWTTLRAKRARSSFSSAIIVLMSKR